MSGPSESASPPSAPPGPPPGPPPAYPPYPPYPPYPWYPPPRTRDNTVLILVIVLVLVVLVPVVLSAILYVMVSGLITGPGRPSIFLGPADLANGNATIRVHADAAPLNPGEIRIRLRANDSASAFVAMPLPDGSVSVTAGPYTLRVFWLDNNQDRLVGGLDAFRITGDLSPLPAATIFEFTLQFTRGQTSITWGTP